MNEYKAVAKAFKDLLHILFSDPEGRAFGIGLLFSIIALLLLATPFLWPSVIFMLLATFFFIRYMIIHKRILKKQKIVEQLRGSTRFRSN